MPIKNLRQVHGIYLLKKKHKLIKKMQKRLPYPSIHGYQVWSSSFLIMDYLLEKPLDDKARCMDIGCGWGLLSIFLAKQYGGKVTAVDADDHVFPYLKVHALMNNVKIRMVCSRFEKLDKKRLAKQDFIAGGDVCFWDELVDPLYKVINRAMKQGVKQIIIADPGRAPFLKLAKRCKKQFNAELVEHTVTYPKKADGYLLIIKPKPI